MHSARESAPPLGTVVTILALVSRPALNSTSGVVRSFDTAVSILALVSRPALNGARGVVRSFDTARGRYGVQLENNNKMIVIKTDNLLEVASEEHNSTNEEENQKMHAEVSSAAHAVGAGPRTPEDILKRNKEILPDKVRGISNKGGSLSSWLSLGFALDEKQASGKRSRASHSGAGI